MVLTRSVDNFQSLADDLANPDGSLSSSIGMVIGTAERGKTHSAKWYCQNNSDAAYVLFIDGSSKVQLLRDICDATANTRPYSFSRCITCLEETCKYNRKVVIIDEADKLPLSYLEMLRGINERCNLPFVLVGEEELKRKTDRVPRLRSRIRQPIVVFEKASSLDVAAYYHEAAGIDITREQAQRLAAHANYGFRSIVNDSIVISKMSKASAIDSITQKMLDQLCA
ncbi:MAG: AAA family ATPase [Treponema sp.]|nr:AAA family ATPase [Treponema sp.]MBD5413992.1 AAA family ATPase [Treponema sp.]